MNKKILILLLLSFLFNFCSKKKQKEIIPKEDLIEIIVDLQKTEGVLSIYSVKRDFDNLGKEKIFTGVIENHGYKREQFDSTINFYTLHKVKEFEKIYEKVIEELNKINEQDLSKYSEEIQGGNLWNQSKTFLIDRRHNKIMIPFTIPVNNKGIYTIKAKIKLYHDDEAENPRVRAYYYYSDGSREGFRDYFEVKLYKNDLFTTYIISKQVTNDKVTHLKGWLLYHDEKEGNWSKHVEIKDIEVKYSPQ